MLSSFHIFHLRLLWIPRHTFSHILLSMTVAPQGSLSCYGKNTNESSWWIWRPAKGLWAFQVHGYKKWTQPQVNESKLKMYNYYFLYLLFQLSVSATFGNLMGTYCPSSEIRNPKSALMLQNQGRHQQVLSSSKGSREECVPCLFWLLLTSVFLAWCSIMPSVLDHISFSSSLSKFPCLLRTQS